MTTAQLWRALIRTTSLQSAKRLELIESLKAHPDDVHQYTYKGILTLTRNFGFFGGHEQLRYVIVKDKVKHKGRAIRWVLRIPSSDEHYFADAKAAVAWTFGLQPNDWHDVHES